LLSLSLASSAGMVCCYVRCWCCVLVQGAKKGCCNAVHLGQCAPGVPVTLVPLWWHHGDCGGRKRVQWGWGGITLMLALRAVRLIHGASGARERGWRVFALVVGLTDAIDNGHIVIGIGESRSIRYWPLGIVTLVLTVFHDQGVKREGKRKHGFASFPDPNYGGVAFGILSSGGHGCCCCGHWVLLQGFAHSLQYQGVAVIKWKKHWDACFHLDHQGCTKDAGYTWYHMLNVFQREGRVTIDDGSHHGDVVFGWNLYRDPCRLMYCTGVLPKNYLLSELYFEPTAN